MALSLKRFDVFKSTTLNHIEFFEEGDAYYQSYLDLIRSAEQSIHLQTYIFEMDTFGSQVQKELIRAGLRGVKVYLLIDRFGSMNFSENSAYELVKAGVHFCRFNGFQLKWLGLWGRRLHHKVLLVDQTKSFVGGINVVSSSFGLKNAVPQLDFALYLEGPVIEALTTYCQQIFKRASTHDITFEPVRERKKSVTNPDTLLKISINDWFKRRRQIAKQYSWLVKSAKKDIVIINSYFFPRKKFMKELKLAARRGVRVRLILPKYLDWPSYVLASQFLYSYFLKNGIEIYQWKSSILHGKLATIDNTASTVGSFNLNYTSYQQNLEMNVDVSSQKFTDELNLKIENWILTGCEKIEEMEFVERASLKAKLLRFVFYLGLSFIANFSIGLAFQSPKDHKLVP